MRELSAYLFLTSLLIVSLATPAAMSLARRWGVLDNPGPRKIHKDPIPLAGGWGIFLGLTFVVWGHLLGALTIRGTRFEQFLGEPLDYYVTLTPKLIVKVAPVYAGAVVMFFVGIVDDIKGISVRSRLVVQALVGIVLAACGYHPNLGFLPSIVASAVGVLWIVAITNSFNFLDGLDGLSAGIAMVGTLGLLTVMGISIQPDVVFFLSTLAGTLMGFLRYNYHPARVFLGSSGSLLIGYLMAMGTMQVTYMKGSPDNWLLPLLTPIFILAIPLYDTCSVILIRVLQGRPISTGDQSHFHHRLMKIGFSHRQTVAFMILLSFSISLSAVRLVDADLIRSLLILIQIMSMLSLIILAERVALRVRGTLLERRKKPRLETEPTPLGEAPLPTNEDLNARTPEEQKI
jgi:UDP-GlcNAc:undecaprenyl-phosphate GlcNAc-1-phosphate transferase